MANEIGLEHWMENGRWVSARDLKPGDILLTRSGFSGETIVHSVEFRNAATRVYNFEVERLHNYAVADVGVLVHNTGCSVARAKEVHQAVGEGTQNRTTIAVTETEEGINIVSSSERRLRPDQRSMLKDGEIEGIGNGHAEVTGVNHAKAMGLTPKAVAASRPVCRGCQKFLKKEKVEPLSPLKPKKKSKIRKAKRKRGLR